jgi:hypothetical protein
MTTEDERYGSNSYQLDSGRWVTVEECYIGTSTLGYLAGSPENIRFVRHVIEHLPERVEAQFGSQVRCFYKPLPEGSNLPAFVFMVSLLSDLVNPESSEHHSSHLVVCWLSDDITTSLPEIIKRETRDIEWNKYAADFSY